nr:hypothetical protein [Tanacetum cinerariifolium]
MFGQFMKMNTSSSSGSRTLPGNTITNSKENLKGITTRSGTAYQGPTIHTTSSSSLVVERETEATKDTVHLANNRSTKDVQHLVGQTESPIFNSEPVVAPIIEPVAFPVSAPKPNQRPSISARRSFNFSSGWGRRRCLRQSRNIPFPSDFVVVDFDADPRVPLILKRSFLKTERALIDVFEGKLTLRVGKEAITFNLDQTSSGNPTPYYDPIISTTSPTLTPFGNSDFLLEEVNAFLALDDDATSPKVDQSYFDSEGDILLLEAFLNDYWIILGD